MAEKGRKKGGVNYCSAGGPNLANCGNKTGTPGISMHYFPPEESLRDKWTQFVRRHRKDFIPKKRSCLCSVHFEENCFEHKPVLVQTDDGETIELKKNLIKGSIPTKDTVVPIKSPLNDRKRRQIMRGIRDEEREKQQQEPSCKSRKLHLSDPLSDTSSIVSFDESSQPISTATSVESTFLSSHSSDSITPSSSMALPCDPIASTSSDTTLNTPLCCGSTTPSLGTSGTPRECNRCPKITRKIKALQRRYNRLQKHYAKLEERLKTIQNEQISESEPDVYDGDEDEQWDIADANMKTGDTESETETDWASQEDSAPSAEDYTSQSEEELDDIDSSNTVSVEPGTSPFEEPKFIVFFSTLLSLFSIFCFKCKERKPKVTMKQRGTMVIVKQHCLSCGGDPFIWRSQPFMFGRYPAGNVLLSFSVLMAGASISKILLVFRHMGLAVFSARTFFFHQKSFLFPAILHYWERYQAALIAQLKNVKDVVWSGDGRFDSMGHSAKYGVYSMFCNTILKVVHFELLQANETGGSSPMELEGAKRAFLYLQSVGLKIAVFISDRHRGIAKWIRENQVECAHYFDIWHVARSITKKMIKLGKEKGCEKIADWVKGARNHLYWSAMSTKQGFGEMIVAKWKSFMEHVANKHVNFQNNLFKKCAHREIENRRWIRIGTSAYNKLHKLLMSTGLISDIKKLSPDAQTSCLEGFHSTLNHWHPKMVCFSWLGTFCRHILASLHFNENVLRQTQQSDDGTDYYKVTFPKFKLGEEVVREVAVPPTYGYVDEIRRDLLNMSKDDRQKLAQKYNGKVPQPLNTQFPGRANKSAAVEQYTKRNEREATQLYPAAEEQDALQATTETVSGKGKRTRRPAKCRTCGKPMRGHSASACRSGSQQPLA